MIRISDTLVAETIEARFMGDAGLFRNTAKVFLVDQARQLDGVMSALRESHMERVAELIHEFKGSLSYFHRREPVLLAEEIESLARGGRCDRLDELLGRFDTQLQTLNEELRILVEDAA